MENSLHNLLELTEHESDQVLWVLENKEVLERTDLGVVKLEPVDQDDHQKEHNNVDINKEQQEHITSDTDVKDALIEDVAKETIVQSTDVNERDPLDISQSTCQICQAEAHGPKFYRGICCYSCRTFFKRSGGSVFLCSKGENNCIINKATRTRCKKCRYKRCLDAGLKPHFEDKTLSSKISQEVQYNQEHQVNEIELVEIKLETVEGNLEEHKTHTYSKDEENILFYKVGKDGDSKVKTEPDLFDESSKIRVRKRISKKCPICGKEMKNVHSHIANVHKETLPEDHTCNHCGKVFSKSENLRAHCNAVHKVQPATCDICLKELKNQHALRGHKKRVHERISKESCPSCFKVFDNKLKLYFHVRAVHTLEDSICQTCGKNFKNKFSLKKHLSEYHRMAT